MARQTFRWEPGEGPPPIEAHSRAKLDVLRRYLRAYFNTLAVGHQRDKFKLDLVDGFAGGGTYLDNGEEISGSPLVMLEESKDAEVRLNEGREARLHFDVKHHFVEANHAHAEHLHQALHDRGYLGNPEDVALYARRQFNEVLDDIVADIARRQPRSGRSIFLLDQCGYTDANFEVVHRIGKRLSNAEVILTIAVDAWLNTATERNIVQRSQAVGLSVARVRHLLRNSDQHHKPVMQRSLSKLVLESTGFDYFTSFFIRPERSRRELWFIHLSRHLTAREVMLRCHWESRNLFVHYGDSLGPTMLGWEALEARQAPLLTWDANDRAQMAASIGEVFMSEMHPSLVDGVPVVEVLERYGNRTAATFSDMNDVILAARNAGDLEVRTEGGQLRTSSKLRNLQRHDVLRLPRQLSLPIRRSVR